MSNINDFICGHHHYSERTLTTCCPVCLQLSCNAKDAEIAKLKESFLQSQDARQGWLREFDGYKKTILLQQQRLSEATFIIERIGTTDAERPEVIRAAENWLKSKP